MVATNHIWLFKLKLKIQSLIHISHISRAQHSHSYHTAWCRHINMAITMGGSSGQCWTRLEDFSPDSRSGLFMIYPQHQQVGPHALGNPVRSWMKASVTSTPHSFSFLSRAFLHSLKDAATWACEAFSLGTGATGRLRRFSVWILLYLAHAKCLSIQGHSQPGLMGCHLGMPREVEHTSSTHSRKYQLMFVCPFTV